MATDFCSLGMFIIDDIHPPQHTDQEPKLNVIGGAGTYSAIGARLFSPPPLSKSVGWVVDAGTDFSDELTHIITSWDTGVVIRPRPAPTTRGWNGYSGNQHRAFKYLTEKKRLTADDLTEELAAAKSFHLICSPLRAIDQVNGVLSRHKLPQNVASDLPDLPLTNLTTSENTTSQSRPIFIWEPVPDLCTPDEMQNTLEALRHVDVISPNHEELAAIFSYTHPEQPIKEVIEEHAQRLLDSGIGPQKQGAVVVRVGPEGCFILTPSQKRWLPAYHSDQSRVIDPTGGGNGFLGGLAVGLVGMPVLTPAVHGRAEMWNNVKVLERLAEYRKRAP
ncbi:hypothetical protein BST61_g1382 [Cercospora zeina]